ncbi:MAG: P-loop NTPase [Clostridiales Family XIII bacterium]|jgi:septum site-determining protein MinD|nr:P-loop NTPase [Clostridiales Family XIII bacterium]
MGRLYLIASGKGGVGKSVFASNIGAVYAERGIRVALVDMNVGLRNLDLYMGLEDHVIFDIADVLAGVVPPRKAFVRDRRFQYLYFMATTQQKGKFRAGPDEMRWLYRYLKANFDVVIVDGPAGVNRELMLASMGVNAAVMLATPEYVSLRDADQVEQTLRRAGVANRVYVVNKVFKGFLGNSNLPTVGMIANTMKIPLLGVIQHDDAIHLAANGGVPAVCGKESYITRNFNKIADRLLMY